MLADVLESGLFPPAWLVLVSMAFFPSVVSNGDFLYLFAGEFAVHPVHQVSHAAGLLLNHITKIQIAGRI